MRDAADVVRTALIPGLTMVTAIAVLAIAVYLIRSWLRENDGPAASAHELLAEYRELNRRGELSDEEFRIIKGRMASRIGPRPDPMHRDCPALSETGEIDDRADQEKAAERPDCADH